MARVKTSAIISTIQGKLNGSVFQNSQGGLIIRNQGAKINSNTLRSNSHRVGLSAVQGEWQNLTNAQRLLWQTYSLYLNKKQKHSTSLIVSGHQLFIDINTIRYDLSSSNVLFQPYLLSTPILAPLPLPINITAITRFGLSLVVTLDRAVVAASEVLILYLSSSRLPSQMSAYAKLILMKAPTTDGFNFLCYDYYESVYGRVVDTGEYIQSKIAIYSTASQNYSSYSVLRRIVS